MLQDAGSLLKTSQQDLPRKISSLLEKSRSLEKALEIEQSRQTAATADQLASQAEVVGGISLVVARLSLPSAEQLREAADRIRDRIGPGVVVLAAEIQGKAVLVAMAAPQAVKRGIHAGSLIRETAKITGGSGGGRPDMAQAGGAEPDRIPEALLAARDLIVRKLQGE